MIRVKSGRIVAAALVFFLSIVACFASPSFGQTARQAAPVVVPYYEPPDRMELCGEPVPLQIPDVWERLDREFIIVVYSHAQVYLWLKRMQRYFPWIEEQLRLYGLPDDLKWVAVAESDLLYTSCSPAGAVGPWQFIPSTGRRYGLSQSKFIDERQDYEKATASAFRYLKDLYSRFHNWALALAAYNCGEGRIEKEMARQKVGSYYQLKLPLETERYVFRILAIKEVLSHPEKYGYEFPRGAGYSEVPIDRVHTKIPYPMDLLAVAQAAQMTYREFKVLNPAFKSDTIPPGTYTIKVRRGSGDQFQIRLASIKPKYIPPKVIRHKVKRGENLTRIARKYGVRVKDLRKWNKLKGSKIRIGQILKIYR